MKKQLTLFIFAFVISFQPLVAQKSKFYPVPSVPEELISGNNQVLLCLFLDLDEKQLFEEGLTEYYTGNYELIDYDTYLTSEKYKDLSKYRFALFYDLHYGQSEAAYGDEIFYAYWTLLDREIELRCVYPRDFKKESLKFYLKRIEKKRAKANK